MTIDEAFKRYMKLKVGLRPTTEVYYRELYNLYIQSALGQKQIHNLKYSDVYQFYVSLYQAGFSYSTIHNVQSILHPLYEFEIRDGIIQTNPTNQIIKEMKKAYQESKRPRKALTMEEQRCFMTFLKERKEYESWYQKLQILIRRCNQELEEKGESARVPKCSPHILRHTFATRLCEQDVNIKLMSGLDIF